MIEQLGLKNLSLVADSNVALKTIAYDLEQDGRLPNNKLWAEFEAFTNSVFLKKTSQILILLEKTLVSITVDTNHSL